MNQEILTLLDIEQSIFNTTLNIIFDILEEIFQKGGLAYVDSNDDTKDLVDEYINKAIIIIQNGFDIETTKLMLDMAYIKLIAKLSEEQILTITILKLLFPYIQEHEIDFIVDFQNHFCSQDTIIQNLSKIKNY